MGERPPRADIAARRAKVAEYLIQRMTYRDMGALLGVSDGTIAADVKALRKEWAKTYADVGAHFERAAMDQDTLQAMILKAMGQVAPEDLPAFFGRLINLMDQRNKLHGLYPDRGSKGESEIPTGPIVLEIALIEPGNRQLIDEDPPIDDDDE